MRAGGLLVLLFGPERVREATPLVPQIGPTRHALKLPVHANERPEIGVSTRRAPLLEDTYIPRAGIDAELGGEYERAVAKRIGGSFEAGHV